MTCLDKVFISTHTEIQVTVLDGFTVADISNISVEISCGLISVTKTLGSGVEISGSTLIITLDNSDITVSGLYKITAVLTDTSANVKRLNVCEEFMRFYD